jgi:hypothetical protein
VDEYTPNIRKRGMRRAVGEEETDRDKGGNKS